MPHSVCRKSSKWKQLGCTFSDSFYQAALVFVDNFIDWFIQRVFIWKPALGEAQGSSSSGHLGCWILRSHPGWASFLSCHPLRSPREVSRVVCIEQRTWHSGHFLKEWRVTEWKGDGKLQLLLLVNGSREVLRGWAVTPSFLTSSYMIAHLFVFLLVECLLSVTLPEGRRQIPHWTHTCLLNTLANVLFLRKAEYDGLLCIP